MPPAGQRPGTRPAATIGPARTLMYRRRRRAITALTTLVLLAGAVIAVLGDLERGEATSEAFLDGAAPATAPTPTAVPPSPGRSSSAVGQSRTRPRSSAPAASQRVQVPYAARGRLVPVPLALPANTRAGREIRYRVEVESGLPFPAEPFARTVHAVLGHPRGWQGVAHVRFRLVASGPVDLTVTLASPRQTDRLCAPLRTRGEVSCWNGSRAVLNAKRWALGSPTYGDALDAYRRYLVAHEVGHGLGRGHENCPGAGASAPVMVQQTKSLQGCRANPYPAVG
jgi:hypothetical protein